MNSEFTQNIHILVYHKHGVKLARQSSFGVLNDSKLHRFRWVENAQTL